jgi:hypothetical protein
VSPDLVVFVMDGSIGQAAFDQATAFKESVEVRTVHVQQTGETDKESAMCSPLPPPCAPCTVCLLCWCCLDSLNKYAAYTPPISLPPHPCG